MSYFSDLDATLQQAAQETEREVVSFLETARHLATDIHGVTDMAQYRDYVHAKANLRRRLQELQYCPLPH